MLKKGAVFTTGVAVIDPVGGMEKKFGTPIDVVGAATLSEDGAVTVIFGT